MKRLKRYILTFLFNFLTFTFSLGCCIIYAKNESFCIKK